MLLWRKIWTSTLNCKKSHPFYGIKLDNLKIDNLKIETVDELDDSVCDINGFEKSFLIFIDDYNKNIDFLTLPYISPRIALQTNQYNNPDHRLLIENLDVELYNYKIKKNTKLSTMDNIFFGLSNKYIYHELFCGFVGPESSQYLTPPEVISIDVIFNTTEIHYFKNIKYRIQNTHHLNFISDIETIDWVLNEIH